MATNSLCVEHIILADTGIILADTGIVLADTGIIQANQLITAALTKKS